MAEPYRTKPDMAVDWPRIVLNDGIPSDAERLRNWLAKGPCYVSLHSAMPGAPQDSNEVSFPGYQRLERHGWGWWREPLVWKATKLNTTTELVEIRWFGLGDGTRLVHANRLNEACWLIPCFEEYRLNLRFEDGGD